MAAVAPGATEIDGADEGTDEYRPGGAGGHAGVGGLTIHLAHLGPSGSVEAGAQDREAGAEFAEIAGGAEPILIAEEFISGVGREAERAAKGEASEIEGTGIESAAAGGSGEEGAVGGEAEEAVGLHLGLGAAVEDIGEVGFDAAALAGDDGIVVIEEAEAEVGDVEMILDVGEDGVADAASGGIPGGGIAGTEFRGATELVAEVGAKTGIAKAVVSDLGAANIDGESGIAGEGAGGSEEAGALAEGDPILGGEAIAGAEDDVVAPFGAGGTDSHPGKAGTAGDAKVFDVAAIDFEQGEEKWRGVVALLSLYEEFTAADGVTQGGEASGADGAGEFPFEDGGVPRLGDEGGEGFGDEAGLAGVFGFDFDGGDLGGLWAAAGGARLLKLGPFGCWEGEGLEDVFLLGGGGVTRVGEFATSGVVAGIEAGEVDGDDDVGAFHHAQFVGGDDDADGPLDDAGEGVQRFGVDRGLREMDSDDDVGSHLPGDIDGEILEDGAIDIEFAAAVGRSEDAGEGHGGAEGIGEDAFAEDLFFAGDKIGGDAAEGSGEVVEGVEFGVGEGPAAEEDADLMAEIETGGKGDAAFETEFEEVGEGGAVFAAAEGEVAEVDGAAEELIPGSVFDDGAEFSGGAAGGVEAADEAAHAGAGDVVDGDAVLLEPFEDADMGDAEGAAAFEGDGYLLAGGGGERECGKEKEQREPHRPSVSNTIWRTELCEFF